jgi:hypothetical protein
MRILASAAAWSPNPKNPPFFFDLPSKAGRIQPDVASRWAANAPLAMIHQYVPNLKSLKAVAVDVGDQDVLAVSNKELNRILALYDIPHSFEIYAGDHTNRMAVRVETKVLLFFSRHLSFAAAPPFAFLPYNQKVIVNNWAILPYKGTAIDVNP